MKENGHLNDIWLELLEMKLYYNKYMRYLQDCWQSQVMESNPLLMVNKIASGSTK